MSDDERAALQAEIGRLRERVKELLLALRQERRERQLLAGLIQQGSGPPRGCICPPGAERGCRGVGCPRATFVPRGVT